MIQFITDSNNPTVIEQQVSCALAGGIRWIQLRMKNASGNEISQTAQRIVPLCHDKNAKIIIDDHVELVRSCRFDGVHLGRNDMHPNTAREILGDDYIIGYTVNNENDAYNAKTMPINYVGIGPLRFTSTKQNLAPVLGISGVEKLIKIIGPDIPAVVIGGIGHTDIEAVKRVGAVGVAVSGAIAKADDMTAAAHIYAETDNKF